MAELLRKRMAKLKAMGIDYTFNFEKKWEKFSKNSSKMAADDKEEGEPDKMMAEIGKEKEEEVAAIGEEKVPQEEGKQQKEEAGERRRKKRKRKDADDG